jgi:hypothetical protein
MVKTVTVNSQMKYEAVVRNLERLGELRVKSISTEFDGKTRVIFRERTLGEFFKEILPWNKTLALESRQAVLDAFKPLIKNELHSEQLLQNIKDRVDHNVGLTGYALKCDYQPVLRGARPSPLQGGTVASIRKGNGVHLIEADPAKIKCDHAVLLASTAIAELSQYPAHSSLKEDLSYFVWNNKQQAFGKREASVPSSVRADVSVDLSASTWACVTDLELPTVGTNQAKLDPQDLSILLEESVEGKQGSVVIEIMPDHCIEKSEKRTYSYTDDGLRSQIAIARKLVNNAKASNQNLNITFACKDRAVLNRMQKLGQTKISSQPGTVTLEDG